MDSIGRRSHRRSSDQLVSDQVDLRAGEPNKGWTFCPAGHVPPQAKGGGRGVQLLLCQQNSHQRKAVAVHPDRSRNNPSLPQALHGAPRPVWIGHHRGAATGDRPRHNGGRGGEGDPEAAEPCPCPTLVREPKTESARVAPGVNGGNDQLTVRKSSPSNI